MNFVTTIMMKSMFIVFVMVLRVFNVQVECSSDFAGIGFNEPVDYSTACGEPFDGEFPWLVNIHKTIRTRFSTANKFQCIGTIIDNNTVILTAHCVVSFDGKMVNPSDILIEVGKTTFTGKNAKTKEYTGRDIIVHPMYTASELNDDIALLKLTDPIEFSSYVHPICLTNDISKFDKTQLGIVPVWTYLNDYSTEDILETAHLPIIYNNSECVERDPTFFASRINDRNFCAGDATKSYNLCRGSTGMSLALIEETRTKFIWYLKGVLSFANVDPVNRSRWCAQGAIVFSDIFKFYDWIIENKNNT